MVAPNREFMCGINGIALSTRSGRRLDQDTVVRMREVIRHRGHDDPGIFVDSRIGLGHRRLSIVDVAAGHQPMTNEADSLQISYNGEIYNRAGYRRYVEHRCDVSPTHCDRKTNLSLCE